jgi:hypothetical protein
MSRLVVCNSMKREKLCHECYSEMRVDQKSKSKVNPKTGNCHNIIRYVCDVCGITDTIHGSEAQDDHHTKVAVKESKDILNN